MSEKEKFKKVSKKSKANIRRFGSKKIKKYLSSFNFLISYYLIKLLDVFLLNPSFVKIFCD